MHGGLDVATSNKRGRPRKAGDRYPGGQLKAKHVTVEDRRLMAGIVWQRLVQDGFDMGLDPRLQSVIGKMALHGILTSGQAAVADHIGEVIGRWQRLEGMPRISVASPAYDRGYGSALNPSDSVNDHERRVRRAKKAAERVYDMIPDRPSLAREAIHKVCIENQDIPAGQHEDLARLLTVIGQKLGLISANAVQEKRERPKDNAGLAAEAIESVVKHFSDRGATPSEYSVDTGRGADEPRSITVYGSSKFKRAEIEKTYTTFAIERTALGASALDAALVSAAEMRGWSERLS